MLLFKKFEIYCNLAYNIISLSLVPGVIKGTSYIIQPCVSNYYGGFMMRLFSRRKFAKKEKNFIIKSVCDAEIKVLITNWLEGEYWSFADFPAFLESTGLKTPVRLSDLDRVDGSFKCTSIDKEVKINLISRDWFYDCPELWITEEDETKKYWINSNCFGEKNVPTATLGFKDISRNGKELRNFYSEYYCHRILIIDSRYKLDIEIYEPENGESNNPTPAVLRNCKQVEDYLLTLDTSLALGNVYSKVLELLEFSREEISKSKKIQFSYIETFGEDNELERSKILKENDQMQEYAVSENGETFSVSSKTGNWRYISNNVQITYCSEQNSYDFCIKGTEAVVSSKSPAETLIRVKKIISKIMENIK